MVLKIEGKQTVVYLALLVAVLMGLSALASFGFLDFGVVTSNLTAILTAVGSLILLSEIGFKGFTVKGINGAEWVTLLLSILGLGWSVFTLIGMPIGMLAPIAGVIQSAIAVLAIAEIFFI